MRIAPLADVQVKLSAYLAECGSDGLIIMTKNGSAVAALLAPVDDDDLESLMSASSPRFQGLIDESCESIKAGKRLSWRDFWKAVAGRNAGRRKVRRSSTILAAQPALAAGLREET